MSNFLKQASARNQRNINKSFHVFIIIFLTLFTIIGAVNAWQIYKLYSENKVLVSAQKDVEILDSVIQENNGIKAEIKQLQNKIIESADIVKANNRILDLIISIANIIPEDAYLDAFSFKPTIKLGVDLPNIADDGEQKEYGLGKIKLKGYTSSKSITEFLERLSRLEIVDNVKLIYLKYPETQQSNLLEFSIKLLLNRV
ncbi:MAG: PilN domain-containing protein [Candidatus Babeliales bacterium]|nr:PilN domain-containing protein [Candidatus Babeliales bacterium]